jgi:hypothetical protein
MVNIKAFRQLALSFPETEELLHFEKSSFRVSKKIFATLDLKKHLACIKLPEIDQHVFTAFNNSIIYPVPNKWGKQGWTYLDLKKIPKNMLTDALTLAYCKVAPHKLSSQLKLKTQE